MKKFAAAFLFILLSIQTSISQTVDGDLPRILLPVSSGYNERDMAISPDGKDMYYTIQALRNGLSVIVHRTMKANQWSDAEVASFSGQFSDLEAAFSPDGKKLFFVSNRPLTPGGDKKDYDIWFLEKEKQGWSEPIHSGMEVNSTEDEYFPSITNDGSLYFTGIRSDVLGKEDIYKCSWKDNQFQQAINIGAGVNSKLDEFNAFVDPGEKYILFSADGGEGDLGRGDLYISHRSAEGKWSTAKNLGATVNTSRLDYCPYVYKDTFYFTSERSTPLSNDHRKLTWNEIKTKLDSWGNGWGDIYYRASLKTLLFLPQPWSFSNWRRLRWSF